MSFESKVNILLVDDYPENLLALEAILDSLGQNLVRATSGAEALRCLLNQDFAVILLDVQMPDMDGFDTATLIRQREQSRHTPIIFLTAFSSSDNMVFKGYSLGAVDYLFKPINSEILKYKVAAFVDLFQKTAEVKRQAVQLAAMNAELKKREEMFRSLSACSPVGIFLTDTEGKCTYTNPRYQAICGVTLKESLGSNWTQKINPEDQKQVSSEWYAAFREGQEYKGEFRILSQEGTERWVSVSCAPMLELHQVTGYVGTLEDITKRKQAEEEHLKLICEQTARQEAETANRLKDEFLATLSHELRTPLTSILGWAKLLRQRRFDEKATSNALEIIERNAILQAKLIEDILDVSRIMRGKLHLNLCPVNLVSVIATVVESVQPQAEAKNIQLEYIIEPTATEDVGNTSLSSSPPFVLSSPFVVSGDLNRLQQIVSNIISNAIKFTPSGGRIEVRLSVLDENLETQGQTEVTTHPETPGDDCSGRGRGGEEIPSVILHREGSNSNTIPVSPTVSYVQMTFSDTGCGISPDFLPYVFERFRQADGSITRNQGGLGLGLAIVRHLVELHRGSVRVESPGFLQGATFIVKLPLLKARASGHGKGLSRSQPTGQVGVSQEL